MYSGVLTASEAGLLMRMSRSSRKQIRMERFNFFSSAFLSTCVYVCINVYVCIHNYRCVCACVCIGKVCNRRRQQWLNITHSPYF